MQSGSDFSFGENIRLYFEPRVNLGFSRGSWGVFSKKNFNQLLRSTKFIFRALPYHFKYAFLTQFSALQVGPVIFSIIILKEKRPLHFQIVMAEMSVKN